MRKVDLGCLMRGVVCVMKDNRGGFNDRGVCCGYYSVGGVRGGRVFVG